MLDHSLCLMRCRNQWHPCAAVTAVQGDVGESHQHSDVPLSQ